MTAKNLIHLFQPAYQAFPKKHAKGNYEQVQKMSIGIALDYDKKGTMVQVIV